MKIVTNFSVSKNNKIPSSILNTLLFDKALAIDGENIFSSAYIKKHRLSAASTVQKSASVLLENGIIERSGSNYFIGDPFFKRFILGYAS